MLQGVFKAAADLSTPPERGEARAARRLTFSKPPLVALSVGPHFGCLFGRALNLSVLGIGLLLARPLARGTRVAIAWPYGPPYWQCNVLAVVVHATVRPPCLWRVGCKFEIPLSLDDVREFVLQEVGPVGFADLLSLSAGQ